MRLRGARVTIVENDEDEPLTCSYTAADGSVVTFDGECTVGWAVQYAGLGGVVKVDMEVGLPLNPLPKPQDAEGREADIWLCVPEAEPFATAVKGLKHGYGGRKGLAFFLITQPRDETVAMTPSEAAPLKGERVISLTALELSQNLIDKLHWNPPGAELRF